MQVRKVICNDSPKSKQLYTLLPIFVLYFATSSPLNVGRYDKRGVEEEPLEEVHISELVSSEKLSVPELSCSMLDCFIMVSGELILFPFLSKETTWLAKFELVVYTAEGIVVLCWKDRRFKKFGRMLSETPQCNIRNFGAKNGNNPRQKTMLPP